MTVLFCDLVGSTAMSEELDPENMRDILRDYREISQAAARRYGGRIVQFSGDGVLLSFGHPEAHEDDASRAVHAGLQILNELRGLSDRLAERFGQTISARLAVHTGLVVAGDLGRGRSREGMALIGEAPNVAARLQSHALADTLIVSGDTARLVEGLFRLQELGSCTLKGVGRAVEILQVLGPSDVLNTFEARVRRGLFPFVGREREHRWLADKWSSVQRGHGRLALISGEPGIGKSRLIRNFRNRLGEGAASSILCYCSPFRRNSAFFPIVEQFERSLRFTGHEGAAEKLDRLDGFLSGLGLGEPNDAAALASFLSVGNDGRYPLLALPPRHVKALAMEAAAKIVAAMAGRRPVVMVVEDVHWIDPSSLDLLQLLARRIAQLPVLMLISHRPEFPTPFGCDDHVSTLGLERLPEAASRSLIANVIGDRATHAQLQSDILAKADGVPLFLEELTRAVLDAETTGSPAANGTTGPRPPAVPTSLQGSLLSRLDRLGPTRSLAQLAAAIGRRFSGTLLQAVSSLPETVFAAALDRLLETQLVYRVDRATDLYEFKHALVQDVAYDSLLNRARAKHHSDIAEAIERHFPERVEAEPEILAHHYARAGLTERALPYWRTAGQRALEAAAIPEALAYLNSALESLASLPANAERDREELGLLVSRGLALTATGSYASPEVGENYARAHELCRRLGNAPQIFPVLHGLYRFYLVRAELDTALKTTNQLLSIATAAANPTLAMEAHQAQSFSHGFRGELADAQIHCDKCMALFAPERLQGRLHVYSTDTAASVLCLAALIAWLRGAPDRAEVLIGQALARAREVAHSYTIAWTLNFSAVMCQVRGDVAGAGRFAEDCIAHAAHHEFPLWLAGGRIMRGWSQIAAGQGGDEALQDMRDALRMWRATGAVVFSPYYLCCLVEAHRHRRQPNDVSALLEETLAEVQRTGERWWEPELHRLRGELLLDTGGRGRQEAESSFRRALALAEAAGATSLRLRAALSLARLADGTRGHVEALDLVRASYRAFEDGLETPDLRATHALIQASAADTT